MLPREKEGQRATEEREDLIYEYLEADGSIENDGRKLIIHDYTLRLPPKVHKNLPPEVQEALIVKSGFTASYRATPEVVEFLEGVIDRVLTRREASKAAAVTKEINPPKEKELPKPKKQENDLRGDLTEEEQLAIYNVLIRHGIGKKLLERGNMEYIHLPSKLTTKLTNISGFEEAMPPTAPKKKLQTYKATKEVTDFLLELCKIVERRLGEQAKGGGPSR